MAVGRGVPIFQSVRALAHTDPVRDGEHIVLLFDICLLQKRLVSRIVVHTRCITMIVIRIYITQSQNNYNNIVF